MCEAEPCYLRPARLRKNFVTASLFASYLDCEDFKRHSFPNVLIEILSALFRELDRNLHGWFGKNRKAKNIVRDILKKLNTLQKSADILDEEIRRRTSSEASTAGDVSGGADVDKLRP
jgi:hypothetical protein